MNAQLNVADVEPVVASLTFMNDRTPTSGKSVTKVGQRIRNGSHLSCVGMDQDDLGYVKQASIGASKMDHGMESNDGWQMDDDWNQVFKMMDNVRFASQVSKARRALEPLPGSPQNLTNQSETVRKYDSAPSGRLAGSTATPNFINQSETVRNHITILCSRALKLPTKSFYLSNNHMDHANESHSQTEKKFMIQKRAEPGVQASEVSTALLCATLIVRSRTTPNHFISRIVL